MVEAAIRIRAGTAARAKKASDVADHMEVASVLNPTGLSTIAAGSSFIVVKKTIDAPAMIPGNNRGTVMEDITPRGLRPMLRAASSICGLI